MLHAKARWKIRKPDEQKVEQLASSLNIHPLLVRLMLGRGIETEEEMDRFLNGTVEQFRNPFLLKGMEEAVPRIQAALNSNEKIRIYGDYDADGVSSTSLMVRLLRKLNANFDYYIPHRIHEGYGLNKPALEKAKMEGVSLLITVDTGISAYEEVNYAKELGIDVIVTDHHEPPALLPEAYTIINPKQHDCKYPFKGLAGVGVAFKLAQALLGRVPEELLEFATIGTVADLMPLLDENRLIVKLGLKRMSESAYKGIQALLDVSSIDRMAVTSSHVGFSLGPKINASGRLEHAGAAVRLLTTDDGQEAKELAEELDALNKERQLIVDDMIVEALSMVEELQQDGNLPRVLVLAKEGWNAGVIGIVASKILEKHYRPTIVLSIDAETGKCKGSARSISGFDLYAALSSVAEWMVHYGGHQAAAGMTIKKEYLAPWTEALNRLADEWLTEEDLIPLYHADAECKLEDVPLETISLIDRLAPFGISNPSPRFVLRGLPVEDMRTMGKESQHVRFTLSNPSVEIRQTIEAVGFHKGHLTSRVAISGRVDLLGELSVNEWNGVRKPQIIIQDLAVPHVQIFDWRSRGSISKVDGLFKDSGALPAIICFSPEDRNKLAKGWIESYACFGVSDEGHLIAWNELAEHNPFAQIKDAVLYSLPEKLEDLKQVLGKGNTVERWYAIFAETTPFGINTLPSRDSFKGIYSALLKGASSEIPKARMISMLQSRSGLSPAMIQFILSVFEELAFIKQNEIGYITMPSPEKKDLTESRSYRKCLNRSVVDEAILYSTSAQLSEWIVAHHVQSNNKEQRLLEEIV